MVLNSATKYCNVNKNTYIGGFLQQLDAQLPQPLDPVFFGHTAPGTQRLQHRKVQPSLGSAELSRNDSLTENKADLAAKLKISFTLSQE